jgi:hypothetical protein
MTQSSLLQRAARAAAAVGLFCGPALCGDPALTIYNQSFAVVREVLPLDLQAGNNPIRFSGVSAHVEPDSVILRDASGKHAIQILEQNYRGDALSEGLLLSLFEGKSIEFAVRRDDGTVRMVTGKIVRSGYVPHTMAYQRYGVQYQYQQAALVQAGSGTGQPIIEVDGKLQFALPGMPIFPTLGDDTILKPTLDWIVHSGERAKFDAELSYVSGGMSWWADYNAVAPESGDTLELVGWVTLDNQSGKQFDHAQIKLMAGDVSKVPAGQPMAMMGAVGSGGGIGPGAPQVTERTFDDYHLYSLPHPTTLRDRETKQVEFLRAAGISAKRIYIYDGAAPDNRYGMTGDFRFQPDYGSRSNPKVWTMLEFANATANHLGMPLPAGRMRFYRRDGDGQLEFIGENQIGHTAKDEQLRLYTGSAFDIAGERRQTTYNQDQMRRFVDESFEIKVRNHKKEPVTVRIVEHLYRWSTWSVATSSDPYRKTDSRTIEFEVTLAPDAEKTVTYLAHYTW